MSPKPKPELLPEFPKEARAEAKRWLAAHRGEVPSCIVDAATLCLRLAEQVEDEKAARAVRPHRRR